MSRSTPSPALSHRDGARDERTAIIVGSEPRKLVTIARSLSRAGVRCVIAVPPGHALEVRSRSFASVIRLRGDIAECASILSRVARTLSARWVVPTSDSSLQIVCAAYDDLSRFCAVGAPRPEIVRRVLDKAFTLATAQACGVPVSVSMTIARASNLEPAHQGQGVGIALLLSKGELVTAFQHRRLSENPPSGGVVVVAVSEAVDPRLLDYSMRLLRVLEWDGVAMVEFRHDADTGETALMEVSGHFWGSLPLNMAAGVDFPFYAWELSQEIAPTPPATYPTGLRVRWTAGSLMRAGHVFAERPEDRIGLLPALRQLAADFSPGTKSAMWSWRDPLPAIQEVDVVLVRWVKGLARSTLRAIVPRTLLSILKDSRLLAADRRALYVKRRLLSAIGASRAVSLPRPVHSVLFVCHGNIMRSAAAAGFLRDELRAAEIADVRVASAGTHAHDGRPADARAQDAARQLGLSLREHGASRLTAKAVADADVIFAMDELNYVNILSAFPESRAKVRLFGGMNETGFYRAHEIADPYMSSSGEIDATVALIKQYVAQLARALVAARATEGSQAQSPRTREHGVGA